MTTTTAQQKTEVTAAATAQSMCRKRRPEEPEQDIAAKRACHEDHQQKEPPQRDSTRSLLAQVPVDRWRIDAHLFELNGPIKWEMWDEEVAETAALRSSDSMPLEILLSVFFRSHTGQTNYGSYELQVLMDQVIADEAPPWGPNTHERKFSAVAHIIRGLVPPDQLESRSGKAYRTAYVLLHHMARATPFIWRDGKDGDLRLAYFSLCDAADSVMGGGDKADRLMFQPPAAR